MNNLTPLRKEENPLIGLMERGEKPDAGGQAQPPSALDAKLRHSPNAKQRGHRGFYICPGAALPPRAALLLSSFPGAVSRGRRAGLGTVGDERGRAPARGSRRGQQGRCSVQGDLGFDGLGWFSFGVWGLPGFKQAGGCQFSSLASQAGQVSLRAAALPVTHLLCP